VHLLLDKPEENATEDVVAKYPMIACELLCLEIKELDKALCEPQNLLRLFDFYSPNKMYILRCAYFDFLHYCYCSLESNSNRPLGVTKVLISLLGQVCVLFGAFRSFFLHVFY
jgi:hypothetical protein